MGGGKEFSSISVDHRNNQHAWCRANTFETKILAFSVIGLALGFVGLAPNLDGWTLCLTLSQITIVVGGCLFRRATTNVFIVSLLNS